MLGIYQKEDETDSRRIWSLARVAKKIIIFLLRLLEQYDIHWPWKFHLSTHIKLSILSRSTHKLNVFIHAKLQMELDEKCTNGLKRLREAWRGQSAETDQRQTLWYLPKMSLTLMLSTVWNGGGDWMRTGQTKGLSWLLVIQQKYIDRWGNWIEELSGTDDKAVVRVVRNCEERILRVDE